jgi:hypothetical protein
MNNQPRKRNRSRQKAAGLRSNKGFLLGSVQKQFEWYVKKRIAVAKQAGSQANKTAPGLQIPPAAAASIVDKPVTTFDGHDPTQSSASEPSQRLSCSFFSPKRKMTNPVRSFEPACTVGSSHMGKLGLLVFRGNQCRPAVEEIQDKNTPESLKWLGFVENWTACNDTAGRSSRRIKPAN